MKHEHSMSYFHASTHTNESRVGNRPISILKVLNKIIQVEYKKKKKNLLKFWKVFIKINIILINDSQMFINSNDFQLEEIKQDVNKNHLAP